MAVPRKKVSVAKSGSRHWSWQRVNLRRLSEKYNPVKCSNCWAKKLPHMVCGSCGYYRGKQVISVKVKGKSKNVLEA